MTPVFEETGEDKFDDVFGFGRYNEGWGMPCFKCDLDFGGVSLLGWVDWRFEPTNEILWRVEIGHDIFEVLCSMRRHRPRR